MIISVASKNPVKIEAARLGFQKVFPTEVVEVEGIHVPSGVSDQPMTDDETLQGARTRAEQAKERVSRANFWVGIEGGVNLTHHGMESFAWVVVISREGGSGQSRTSMFFLPPRIAELIHEGKELGEATDIVFNHHNSKQERGTVGFLTNNLINRTSYYVDAVVLALIPFTNKELYR